METPAQKMHRLREIRELAQAPELLPLELELGEALALIGIHSRRSSSPDYVPRLDAPRALLRMARHTGEMRARHWAGTYEAHDGSRRPLAKKSLEHRHTGIRRAMAVMLCTGGEATLAEAGAALNVTGARARELHEAGLRRARHPAPWPAGSPSSIRGELEKKWRAWLADRKHSDGTCKRKRCKHCAAAKERKAREELARKRISESRRAQEAARRDRETREKLAVAESEDMIEAELAHALGIAEEGTRHRAIVAFHSRWYAGHPEIVIGVGGIADASQYWRAVRDAYRHRALEAGEKCCQCGGSPELRSREPGSKAGDFLCFACADPRDYIHPRDGGWPEYLENFRKWPEVAQRAREQIGAKQ